MLHVVGAARKHLRLKNVTSAEKFFATHVFAKETMAARGNENINLRERQIAMVITINNFCIMYASA